MIARAVKVWRIVRCWGVEMEVVVFGWVSREEEDENGEGLVSCVAVFVFLYD